MNVVTNQKGLAKFRLTEELSIAGISESFVFHVQFQAGRLSRKNYYSRTAEQLSALREIMSNIRGSCVRYHPHPMGLFPLRCLLTGCRNVYICMYLDIYIAPYKYLTKALSFWWVDWLRGEGESGRETSGQENCSARLGPSIHLTHAQERSWSAVEAIVSPPHETMTKEKFPWMASVVGGGNGEARKWRRSIISDSDSFRFSFACFSITMD